MSNPEMTIRLMGEADLTEVAKMEQELFSLPWTEQGFRDSLSSEYTIYLAVYCHEELAGYCGLLQSFDEADITNVAVGPKYQNHGIGYRMLQELMRLGNEKGIERFTLEVRAGNAPAIHLYEKLGFHSVGIRKRFYEKPVEDAMIMWRD